MSNDTKQMGLCVEGPKPEQITSLADAIVRIFESGNYNNVDRCTIDLAIEKVSKAAVVEQISINGCTFLNNPAAVATELCD